MRPSRWIARSPGQQLAFGMPFSDSVLVFEQGVERRVVHCVEAMSLGVYGPHTESPPLDAFADWQELGVTADQVARHGEKLEFWTVQHDDPRHGNWVVLTPRGHILADGLRRPRMGMDIRQAYLHVLRRMWRQERLYAGSLYCLYAVLCSTAVTPSRIDVVGQHGIDTDAWQVVTGGALLPWTVQLTDSGRSDARACANNEPF